MADNVYCCEAGHRHVVPTFHSFACGVKARWKGRSVLDVFVHDFNSHSPEYFVSAISIGAITVNDKRVEHGYILRDNDKIVHRVHRHEPPISGEKFNVVPVHAETELMSKLRAIYKPGGIPVHSCGPYKQLCMVALLAQAEGRPTSSYHTVHRLDRLTSGVLLMADDKATAASISEQLREGLVSKRYLAIIDNDIPRYPGTQVGPEPTGDIDIACTSSCPWIARFTPSRDWRQGLGNVEEETVDGQTAGRKRKRTAAASADDGVDASLASQPQCPGLRLAWTVSGHLRVDVPCTTIDSKNGLHGTAVDGEEAEDSRNSVTLFRHVASRFDSSSGTEPRNLSLIEAIPLSGRTHQIRVHLAWLGMPIYDDVVYHSGAAADLAQGHSRRLGPSGSVGHSSHSLSREPLKTCELAGLDLCGPRQSGKRVSAFEASTGEQQELAAAGAGAGGKTVLTSARASGEGPATDEAIQALCPNCTDGPHAFFTPMQLCATDGISLASVEYAGPGWRVKGPDPTWAREFTAHSEDNQKIQS